jgi:hypothetical protein
MLRPLFFEPGIEVVGAVLVRVPPGPGGPFGTLARLARKTGVRYAFHKLGTLAVPSVLGLIERTPVFLDDLCEAKGVPHRTLPTINGERGTATLREWAPEVLISVSSPEKFDAGVLRVASVASMNLHWALLPAYAGIAPYFWVLRNGETRTGLTIHLMAPELDAGDVVLQRSIEVGPSDTSLSLQLRLMQAGAKELVSAVRELPGSLASATPQEREGRSYFSWMSAADVKALRRRGRSLAHPADYRKMLDILRAEKRG